MLISGIYCAYLSFEHRAKGFLPFCAVFVFRAQWLTPSIRSSRARVTRAYYSDFALFAFTTFTVFFVRKTLSIRQKAFWLSLFPRQVLKRWTFLQKRWTFLQKHWTFSKISPTFSKKCPRFLEVLVQVPQKKPLLSHKKASVRGAK